MALSTFQDLWRDVLLMAPNTPVPVAQRLVNNAYVRVVDAARWSDLRQEAEFFIPIGVTAGTVDVMQGSASVVGVGTAWTSALVGRQFYVGDRAPFYTVTAVGSTTSLTLDRPFGEASATGASYAIQLIYLTVPSDFLHFIDIVDVTNNWRMRFGITAEQLDAFDAQRSYSGTSYVFAAIQPTALGGKPRYEIYPRPPVANAVSYHYRYQRRVAELSANADVPIYPIRPQTLREGALAELARWPGLSDRPNPYFSLDLSAFHEKQFQEALARDMRQDQEINQTDVSYDPVWTTFPYAPVSAGFMQSHLFTAWYTGA